MNEKVSNTASGEWTTAHLNLHRTLKLPPLPPHHRHYEPPRDIAPYLDKPAAPTGKISFAGADPNENNEGW